MTYLRSWALLDQSSAQARHGEKAYSWNLSILLHHVVLRVSECLCFASLTPNCYVTIYHCNMHTYTYLQIA